MSFTIIATIQHHLICIIKYHKADPVLKSQFRFKVLDITSLQNTSSHTLLSLLYTAFTPHLQAMPLLLNSYVLVWINFFYTNKFLKPLDFSVRIFTWFSSLLCRKLCLLGVGHLQKSFSHDEEFWGQRIAPLGQGWNPSYVKSLFLNTKGPIIVQTAWDKPQPSSSNKYSPANRC
jgi:hypothetical protein